MADSKAVECDVVITTQNGVFINGTRIGGVVHFEFEQDAMQTPLLTIRLIPTSVEWGNLEPPPPPPSAPVVKARQRSEAAHHVEPSPDEMGG